MQIKSIEQYSNNRICRVIRYLMVLVAVQVISVLGVRSSWPVTIGMLLFTWLFLNYTDGLEQSNRNSAIRKYTIIFTLIFEIIMVLGLNYTCRTYGIELSAMNVIISLPGMYILIYRIHLLFNIGGGIFKS